MTFSTKLIFMDSNLTSFEVAYWQALIMIFLQAVMMKFQGVEPLLDIPKEVRSTIVLRGIAGFTGNILYYTAISLIELSKAAVLFWTNPMFSALTAYIFLRESISFFDWCSILFSFIGVIVI